MRVKISKTRRTSSLRPITGSIFFWRANSVKSRPYSKSCLCSRANFRPSAVIFLSPPRLKKPPPPPEDLGASGRRTPRIESRKAKRSTSREIKKRQGTLRPSRKIAVITCLGSTLRACSDSASSGTIVFISLE